MAHWSIAVRTLVTRGGMVITTLGGRPIHIGRGGRGDARWVAIPDLTDEAGEPLIIAASEPLDFEAVDA